MPDVNLKYEETLALSLREAQETLAAICTGEVDAVVVEGPNGQRVFTLQSPDEPFRTFVDQMQEGALTITGHGNVVYCNGYFADMMGRPLENVQGQSIYSLIDEHEAREKFRSLLRNAATGMARSECELPSKGGDRLQVQIACSRLPAEDSNMFGIVVTDLTAHERARRLDAEREAAEQASAAREQFLAVVSHELRTPLNAILGWIQVLRRRGDLPDSAQGALEIIERNAWMQTKLIDDLLDVSRVLTGKLRLDIRALELRDPVEAALASMQPIAAAKEIELSSSWETSGLYVQADPSRLQQMVANLLSNAVKFTPAGGRVRLTVRQRGPSAEIEVSDTGIGLSPESLPRVFELYQQIEGAATRRSTGLGLGLAIVKQLAELHNGEVWAESEGEGRGTTFTIRLPLYVPNTAVERATRNRVIDAPALEGMRILVVEDEPDSREALAQLLTSAGAIVATASDARAALTALGRDPFQLLIGDIGLPDMDGYELIRRIRTAGRSPKDLPAVALTAFARGEDRNQALLAGYQAHLAKPVDLDELSAVASSLLGRAISSPN